MSTDNTTPEAPRGNQILREIMRGRLVTTILALVVALVIGGILIAVTSEDVIASAGYFFARPSDMLSAIGQAVAGGYSALFRGAIYNTNADDFLTGIRSLTNSIGYAAPLIAAGLGVAVAFRAGLFNIGGQGQIIFGAAFAALIAFPMDLPGPAMLVMVLIGAVVGGAIWAGIVGLLKALTGAHEVILSIMLNYIAVYLVTWMVSTAGVLQNPNGNQPISAATPAAAQYPNLLGVRYPALDWGFVVVLAAAAVVWWLMERSALGMRMRAVGENPHAARAAGISVNRIYIYAMVIAGALSGLAASQQIQGAVTSGFTASIDAGFGFDAITVALLGGNRVWGTVAAGVLFGALKAGSYSMQASEGIPVDIVLVVQAVVVLFVAAPPLVRAIFFLPKSEAERRAKAREKQAKKAVAK
ncbi:ABC transporter permease [Microbacterium indicum]|uniref:ABC transporter permease n=1 Tax=Microbacterium indicum TaxID=358100 RepID=UPI000427D864|nr:ABC transporter permease [Microbacterium indicum]